jgi:hypothetical protein
MPIKYFIWLNHLKISSKYTCRINKFIGKERLQQNDWKSLVVDWATCLIFNKKKTKIFVLKKNEFITCWINSSEV